MKDTHKYCLCGLAAGTVNGLFGGGGGIPLLLLLTAWCHLEEKEAFATSLAVVLPASAVSAAVYILRSGFSPAEALPFLLGGALGGLAGGMTYGKVPVAWLRRLFVLFLLYGAVRYLT